MTLVRRDLRSGRPLWQARRMSPLVRTGLGREEDTDVLVVGAGISGALIAEMLSAEGHRVLVVDRRGPAQGSTAASTALVQYEVDQPLTLLGAQIGAAAAVRAWRRSYLALGGLLARTEILGIDCGLRRRDSLYLAGNLLDSAALEREGEARRAAGLETSFLGRAELRRRYGIGRAAALLGSGNFAVDPRRMTAGYLRQAIANGARLAAPVEVTDLESGSGRVRATTSGGRITCRHLVFATGYEFPLLAKLTHHRLISTYAIATRRQPRALWPGQCLIWEAADPYLYCRTTPDGRAVIGGEDEDFVDDDARDALLPDKAKAIARKAARLFPDLDPTPEFAWAGTFGTTRTGLPTIGRVPGRPGCWAVLGYGGNGITYSRIAAEILRTALAGGTDPDADLYDFAAA